MTNMKMQLLLRETRLHSAADAIEHLEQLMQMQVLNSVHSLPDWVNAPEIQCHCLTVLSYFIFILSIVYRLYYK
jgi:hypothetical protein